MTFEYILTWMILEGFEDVHDSLMKEWILGIGNNQHLREIRFPPLPLKSPRKRILIYVFDDVQGWRRFRKETQEDFKVFLDQWLQFIDLTSFRIFFWRSKGIHDDLEIKF